MGPGGESSAGRFGDRAEDGERLVCARVKIYLSQKKDGEAENGIITGTAD